MPRYWIVICPEPHVKGGLWRRWYKEKCVAIGWPPPEFPLDGPTDDAGWEWTRKCLKQMRSGDKVVPFLLKRRIGPVGTVTELRVGDHEWNPTVETGESTQRPDIPAIGRRVLVDWEREGMPPNEGIARLPDTLWPKQSLARHTVEELGQEKFEEIFSVLSDPANWQECPSASDIQEDAEHIPESTSSDLSLLERDLQKFLTRNLHTVEPGLRANPEYQLEGLITDVGILDLLCQDAYDNWVVIELKAGRADDAAIGQILGYMGWVRENLPNGEKARGMIICKEASPRVKAAAKIIPDLSVKRFQFSFVVESID